MQNQELEARPADTVVILNDACYGHRYSRPRTSKSSLASIVERPERIQASILGLSMAYVRLGQRHAEGRHPPHPKKNPTNIPTIPFRIRKTTRKVALSDPAVTNVHGTKWMEELRLMCDGAEAKLAMNGKELTRPDMTRSPDQEPPAKLHEGDLYLCSESLDAMEGALGAVCEGVDTVFRGAANLGPKRAFIAIRPPGHHCSASYPSGFCWLNNVHVGISHAALHHGLTHAAIIDFDLHHGDGSQVITWEHNKRSLRLPKNAPFWKKPSIGYFSLHDINSYPCEDGDEDKIKNASICIENAHGQNIWNVHLQPWGNEQEFWNLYESKYSVLLEKTRAFLINQSRRIRATPNHPQPNAAIFLSAGFDASEWESSGMQRHAVNVPTEFYARLTRDVVKMAAEEACGVQGRIISVLEGGYSDRALCSGVLSHISGLAGGDPIEVTREIEQNGLGYEMAQKVGSLKVKTAATNEPTTELIQPYDPAWWALPQLEQLDALVKPPPPLEPRKVKDNSPPSYSSPTQSFSAKIVTTPRRSASGLSGSPRPVSRPPSPPPPDVNWATAAYELSKLLIPSERQTTSCKPEDLSAEATRARRDRQSIVTPIPTSETVPNAAPATRMALRGRKPAKLLSTADEEDETDKAISKANRRKTVAGSAVLAAEKVNPHNSKAGYVTHLNLQAVSRNTTANAEPSCTQPTKQSTRRLSLTSSTGSVPPTAAPQLPIVSTRVPSAGTTAIPARPGSSQSVRPGSSMSSKTPTVSAVVVKKTRTANPARSDATKNPRASRKTPPVENAGVSGNRTQERVSLPQALSSSQNTNCSTTSRPSNKSTEDVDSITTGMKKIAINLSTKAQREAREQAKLAAKSASASAPSDTPAQAQNGATAQALKLPQLPQNPKTSLEESQSSSIDPSGVHNTFPKPGVSTPQPLSPSRFTHLRDATNVPLPASSPVIPNAATPEYLVLKSTYDSATDVFVPYQPEGPPPAPIPQQEPLKWLPPNTSTPVAMKRSDLPVFTSTGAIPFGVSSNKPTPLGSASNAPPINGINGTASIEQKPSLSIWDVPDTPQR